MHTAASPYELSLPDAITRLHPRLRAYFGVIPEGQHGFGSGVFSVVGTPRRWLWPMLWILGRQGVLFAAWQHDVPFTVVNRPVIDARGRIAVAAARSFRFPTGSRLMVDAITAEVEGLVDHLGTRRRYAAWLAAEVVDGALLLRSTRMAIRVGRRQLPIPRFIAPRVTLRESFDEEISLQRVSVTLSGPVIGTVYNYAGTFAYAVVPDEASEQNDDQQNTGQENA